MWRRKRIGIETSCSLNSVLSILNGIKPKQREWTMCFYLCFEWAEIWTKSVCSSLSAHNRWSYHCLWKFFSSWDTCVTFVLVSGWHEAIGSIVSHLFWWCARKCKRVFHFNLSLITRILNVFVYVKNRPLSRLYPSKWSCEQVSCEVAGLVNRCSSIRKVISITLEQTKCR